MSDRFMVRTNGDANSGLVVAVTDEIRVSLPQYWRPGIVGGCLERNIGRPPRKDLGVGSARPAGDVDAESSALRGSLRQDARYGELRNLFVR